MKTAICLFCIAFAQVASATDYTATAAFAVNRRTDQNAYSVAITWKQTRFAPAVECWSGTSEPATPQRPIYVSASTFQLVRGTPTMTISVSGGAFSEGAYNATYEAATINGTYNLIRGDGNVSWPASITPSPIP